VNCGVVYMWPAFVKFDKIVIKKRNYDSEAVDAIPKLGVAVTVKKRQ